MGEIALEVPLFVSTKSKPSAIELFNLFMLANILFMYSFFMLECTLAREIFVQTEFMPH